MSYPPFNPATEQAPGEYKHNLPNHQRGKCTDNPTAVALFDHLFRSIFVAQQRAPHVDRPYFFGFFYVNYNCLLVEMCASARTGEVKTTIYDISIMANSSIRNHLKCNEVKISDCREKSSTYHV